MQQTSDVNNDAEALCCFRLVQSVRVQNVTYRRKCHPTHWFRCEHYSEQPCTFVHTSTPWKTDWLGSQAVVTITLTVGIRTWVYQRSVLLPGLTSAVIYSETHKLVLSLKVYGIRCLVMCLLLEGSGANVETPFVFSSQKIYLWHFAHKHLQKHTWIYVEPKTTLEIIEVINICWWKIKIQKSALFWIWRKWW